MSNYKHNTFCTLPWIHQAVRNNGTIRVCCQTNQGPEKGLLKKSVEEYFNAGKDSLDLARNADLLKKTRLQMLSNEWPENCIRCKNEELAGMRSRRMYEQQMWNDFNFDLALKATSPDGSIDTSQLPIRYYDLRFGNKCNLKCRSCGPTDSSSWYGDYFHLYGQHYQDGQHQVALVPNDKQQILPQNDIYDWYESDFFWSQLEKNSHHIQHIYMVGGEPLLIQQHYDFLEKCIKKGLSQNIEIEYNTNGTILPDKAIDLWKSFKKVRIGVSIDGVGAVNDFIRHPSKWDLIFNNLQKLDQTPDNIVVWIAHTVMALNISQLPELIIWRISSNFKKINSAERSPVITPHPLHSPGHLNVQMLLPEIKLKVKEKLDSSIDEIYRAVDFSNYNSSFKEALKKHSLKIIDTYVTYMYQKDSSDKYPVFQSHLNRLNRLRSENTPKEILPYV